MIYFHDTPRFFANLATKRRVASHDCCLRGGASLPSLFREGNGMRNKFRTLRESETDIGSSTVSAMLSSRQYDFLIMNDYTQAPARIERREETLSSLQSDYLPLIRQCGATPVFIITPAYRKQVNNSTDLGSPESFTMKTQEGCEAYASVLDELLPWYQTHKSVALPQLDWHISKYGKRILRCGSVSFTLMIFILVRMEPFCRGVSCIGHSSDVGLISSAAETKVMMLYK